MIITEDTEITKHVCKPCRKQTAPRFVSPVTGMIVDQATDVVLEGIVDGKILFFKYFLSITGLTKKNLILLPFFSSKYQRKFSFIS